MNWHKALRFYLYDDCPLIFFSKNVEYQRNRLPGLLSALRFCSLIIFPINLKPITNGSFFSQHKKRGGGLFQKNRPPPLFTD